jgi:monoamine oxidase
LKGVCRAFEIRLRHRLPPRLNVFGGMAAQKYRRGFSRLGRAAPLPLDGHLICNPSKAATGSYHLRPFGRPLIEGFFGGRLAHELEAAGPGSFFDFAADELAGLFGSGIRLRLRPLVETGWGRNLFARGSYSYALPGHADARAALAAPVDDRLFFAGEACSRHDFTTAHGAYLTGVEAAEEVIALCRHV